MSVNFPQNKTKSQEINKFLCQKIILSNTKKKLTFKKQHPLRMDTVLYSVVFVVEFKCSLYDLIY